MLERAFGECLERLAVIDRSFVKALLLGCPDPTWPRRLGRVADDVAVRDPGALFAGAANGRAVNEEEIDEAAASYDLCVAVGTLDTANDLAGALRRLHRLLRPDAPLIGALLGGDSLPRLRSAMRAADAVTGAATPHVHPRVEASALAPLLSAAGFVMPVVDVDRVRVTYPSLRRLVEDLRRMGATNILEARSRTPLTRRAYAAAAAEFEAAGDSSGTTEFFEILHFIAWTPGSIHA